jgi:hypothetical protein
MAFSVRHALCVFFPPLQILNKLAELRENQCNLYVNGETPRSIAV